MIRRRAPGGVLRRPNTMLLTVKAQHIDLRGREKKRERYPPRGCQCSWLFALAEVGEKEKRKRWPPEVAQSYVHLLLLASDHKCKSEALSPYHLLELNCGERYTSYIFSWRCITPINWEFIVGVAEAVQQMKEAGYVPYMKVVSYKVEDKDNLAVSSDIFSFFIVSLLSHHPTFPLLHTCLTIAGTL